MLRVRNTSRTARALVHMKAAAFGGCDSRRILSAVLQDLQTIVEQLIDGTFCNDPENATHDYTT